MLAGRRADVRKLNLIAREKLKAHNGLRSEIIIATETGERPFTIGDRIVFTRNSRWIGVKNGQTGNLIGWRVDARGDIQVTVQADMGKKVSFSLCKYNHVDHGYVFAATFNISSTDLATIYCAASLFACLIFGSETR